MKNSKLSISNQILSPMIKSRGNPEVIAKLEQEPNPILFSTYDEVHMWFESIKSKQINDRLRTPHSIEEFTLYQAIKVISSQGNVTLVSLLRQEEKLKIKKYADEHTVKSESNILLGLTQIFGTNHKPNVNEWNYSNRNFHVAFSEISYEYLNEIEMFFAEGNNEQLEIANLTLIGRAAFNYLGSLSLPQEREFASELELTLCELYELPLPETAQFAAFNIIANYDFTVMPEHKVWYELKRLLKSERLRRILPKHIKYYYSLRYWDRLNDLIREIDAEIPANVNKKAKFDQFCAELEIHINNFRNEIERSFNYRNTIIYERYPIVFGLICKYKNKGHYRIIKKDIQKRIKTRHIADLKMQVNNDLSYAMTFVNLYYDSELALLPEKGKRGRQYVPPKDALADFILPLTIMVRELGIRSPGYWAVRLINSFVNTDAYSETLYENKTVFTPKDIHDASWAKSRGLRVHGERQLIRDIQKFREKLTKTRK